MSGGVDSSVAAALLQQRGYDVVGCFMRLGSPGETLDELEPGQRPAVRIGHQGCCSINDAADARLVAAKLGIPFYVCNFKRDFGRIIDYFVADYNAGRTPNPCVRCNDWLKFGKLHEYAEQIDAAYVASGHYARIDRVHGRPRLLCGLDQDKDQSYVLFGAPAQRLEQMLLPIGDYRKPQVRRMAEEMGLPVYDKPDSQEICFVPDNDYASLVRSRSPGAIAAGEIRDTAGKVLGEHPGHQHYTIGQRRGLGVAAGLPLYVVDKDPAANTVTVGTRPQLQAGGCRATETNWFVEPPPESWIECGAGFGAGMPTSWRFVSTSRSSPWRRARPWSATTVTRCSAAGGSRSRCKDPHRARP
jgi:tRNA-specific 2-thiouridylase